MDERKRKAYRTGVIVLAALAVLTVAEYSLSITGVDWASVFLTIALVKAFLVVRDYMHLGRLFGEEEH